MIWWTAITVSLLVLVAAQALPSASLVLLRPRELEALMSRKQLEVKLLDVRDASDHFKRHISGSIPISIGRLPVMWSKELSTDDVVIIFAKDWLQRNKASRILARKGFKTLYAAKGCFLKSEEAFGCHEQQYS